MYSLYFFSPCHGLVHYLNVSSNLIMFLMLNVLSFNVNCHVCSTVVASSAVHGKDQNYICTCLLLQVSCLWQRDIRELTQAKSRGSRRHLEQSRAEPSAASVMFQRRVADCGNAKSRQCVKSDLVCSVSCSTWKLEAIFGVEGKSYSAH